MGIVMVSVTFIEKVIGMVTDMAIDTETDTVIALMGLLNKPLMIFSLKFYTSVILAGVFLCSFFFCFFWHEFDHQNCNKD